MVRFDSFDADSAFKATVKALNPNARCPSWSTANWRCGTRWPSPSTSPSFPTRPCGRATWPRVPAPAACAEMHAGFTALRGCPMNIEADLREVGRKIVREQAAVRADLERIGGMWSGCSPPTAGRCCSATSASPMRTSALVASRIRTYGLPVPAEAQAYDRSPALPGVQAWSDEALKEHDFTFDEPYCTSR